MGRAGFWLLSTGCVSRKAPLRVDSSPMHLRMPSIDHGVQSFVWAVVFFLFLWLGMLAVGVSGGTAFLLALIAGVGIFLFVRTFGEEELRPRRVVSRRARR